MSGVFWRRTFFCATESHRIMGSGERVGDSRTVFILMKSW
ncbi:hypothetical protein HJX83_14485 [Klebsiella pneumoniae]|nr:hypothetical protein HJX83_14485 [Klebsiella pneumoniae]